MAISDKVQKLVDDIAANKSLEESVVAALQLQSQQIADLKSQVAAIQPGQSMSAEDVEALTAAAAELESTNTALQSAVPAA